MGPHPNDMKPILLAGAAALALLAAPGHATSSSRHSPAILAADTCQGMADGLTHSVALDRAISRNRDEIRPWLLRTESQDAARQVLRLELLLCPEQFLGK